MGVIIIAVFWLLGLLMAWSMCVVAERADRRMEEIRNAGDGRNNERTLPAENHRGGLPLRPHPHPIRAAAHAPKPVASTGRAV
jgi:hypothetical protein